MYSCLKDGRIRADDKRPGKTGSYLISRLHAATIIGRHQHELPVHQIAKEAAVPSWFLKNVGSIFGIESLTPKPRLVPTSPHASHCFDRRSRAETLSAIKRIYPYWKEARLEPIISFPATVTIPWLATASSLFIATIYEYRSRGILAGSRNGLAYHFTRHAALGFLDYLATTKDRVVHRNRRLARLCAKRLRSCL